MIVSDLVGIAKRIATNGRKHTHYTYTCVMDSNNSKTSQVYITYV